MKRSRSYSSSSSSSSDDERDHYSPGHSGRGPSAPPSPGAPASSRHASLPPLSSSSSDMRAIIHLDVDAFYCQVHELSDPSLSSIPLAIGQKHIVVTCNYVARARGIKKLMLRTDAQKVCPELVIVEGSDLRPYRRASRKIYTAFRKAVAEELAGCNNPAMRGGMDEMRADVTVAARLMMKADGNGANQVMKSATTAGGEDDGVYVFGGGGKAGNHRNGQGGVTISEDQSGATARVALEGRSAQTGAWESTSNRYHQQLQPSYLNSPVPLLRAASHIAASVRRTVFNETGYKSCIGVSVSPMLAKLACGLRKPGIVNVLLPGPDGSDLVVASMPLRAVPGLGSRTLRRLVPILERYNPEVLKGRQLSDGFFWTCRHLQRVPPSALMEAVEANEKAGGALSGTEAMEDILRKCRGIDLTPIVDDGGGLARTVSVEESCRRGTVLTHEGVNQVLETLYPRLILLLDDRKEDCEVSGGRLDLAYPNTICLTVRLVTNSSTTGRTAGGRRPCTTKSKQSRLTTGRRLIQTTDQADRVELLRKSVVSLAEVLLPRSMSSLNVTKLNIAVTNFADNNASNGTSGGQTQQRGIQSLLSPNKSHMQQSSSKRTSSSPTMLLIDNVSGDNSVKVPVNDKGDAQQRTIQQFLSQNADSHTRQSKNASPSTLLLSGKKRKHNTSVKDLFQSAAAQSSKVATSPAATGDHGKNLRDNQIDPAVLDALPPDIAAEVAKEYGLKLPSSCEQKKDKGKIHSYFKKCR